MSRTTHRTVKHSVSALGGRREYKSIQFRKSKVLKQQKQWNLHSGWLLAKAAVITWPNHILLSAPPWTSFVLTLNITQRRSVWVWDKMEFGPAVFKGYIWNSKAKRGCCENCLLKSEFPHCISCLYRETTVEPELATRKSSQVEQNVSRYQRGARTYLTSQISSIFVVFEVAVEFKPLWVQVHLVLTKYDFLCQQKKVLIKKKNWGQFDEIVFTIYKWIKVRVLLKYTGVKNLGTKHKQQTHLAFPWTMPHWKTLSSCESQSW